MSAAVAALLRRQALQNPSTTNLAITQAVMQAVRALLPEFDLIRMNTIPSPVYGTQWPVVGIRGLELGKADLQDGACWDHAALPGSQRRYPAASRSRSEIGVRFSVRKL